MAETWPEASVRPHQNIPDESPCPIMLVDIARLSHDLPDLIQEAARRSDADGIDGTIAKKLECEKFRRAFTEVVLERENLATNPQTAPQYAGLALHGNPVVFFYRNFRLMVEAGGYYQADLYQDSKQLYNALRNLLKHRNWRELLKAADDQLLREGLEPFIAGKRICDMTELSDLLPARLHRPVRRAEAPVPPCDPYRTR
jgi:hypothetical protein